MNGDLTTRIPWDQIQVRWIQGESASSISKSFGGTPTRQGISKRAKREVWQQLPTVSTKHYEMSYLQLGQDTPQNRQTLLDLLSQSVSYTLAAGVIGVSRNTLLNWRKSDPQFAAQCQAARHSALADCAATVFNARIKDWKAGKYLLESAQESRSDYSTQQDRGPIEVVINIDRGGEGLVIEGSGTMDDN